VQQTDPGHENRSPRRHFAEGFQVAGEIERMLVLENCMDPAIQAEEGATEFEEATVKERYRLLSSTDSKKRQKS